MANYSQSAQFNATFENVDTILVNNETIAVYTEVEMGEWDHHLNRATSPSVECSLPDQHQSRHIEKSPSPSPVYAVVQKQWRCNTRNGILKNTIAYSRRSRLSSRGEKSNWKTWPNWPKTLIGLSLYYAEYLINKQSILYTYNISVCACNSIVYDNNALSCRFLFSKVRVCGGPERNLFTRLWISKTSN